MKTFTITQRAKFTGTTRTELEQEIIALLWECDHTFAEIVGELTLEKANEKALKLILLGLVDSGFVRETHSPEGKVVYFITKKGVKFFERRVSGMSILDYMKEIQGKTYFHRLKLIKEFGLQRGMSVLDVGCGNGQGTFPILHFVGPTGRVVGIDYNTYELSYAQRFKRMFNVRNAKFVQTNILRPKLREHFDAVVSFGVLRYIKSKYLTKFVTNMERLCKPGGTVAVAEANPVPRNEAERFYLEFATKGKQKNYYPLNKVKRTFRECGLELVKAKSILNSCLIDAPGSCILADLQHYVRKGHVRKRLKGLADFERFERRYGGKLRQLGCKEPEYFVVVGKKKIG